MATSRWKSSLANIEARMRRSLGISGPINLALEDSPRIMPVAIADDFTRPGCATDLRGRRWASSQGTIVVGGGAVGGVVLRCDAPAGAQGIVFDTLELAWTDSVAPATQLMTFEVMYWTAAQVQAGGLPFAVVTRGGLMVDPMNSATDAPPLLEGNSTVVSALTGGQGIWFARLLGNGAAYRTIPLDLFLPRDAAIGFGNATVSAGAATFWYCWRGRVF